MSEIEKKEDKQEAPKKNKKMLLIGVIGAVVIALGAGGFFVLNAKSTKSAEKEASAEGGHGKEAEKGAQGEAKAASQLVTLEPLIVNLQDNSGTRYLKVTINLELEANAANNEITSQMAQIKDSLIILLSSKSYTDIGTVEGKYQVRDEVVTRVNQFLSKGKVKTAYFSEFVIQ